MSVKSVANYKEQVRTIFCDNCGARIGELPIRAAEKFAADLKKVGEVAQCRECEAVATQADQCLDKIESLRASHKTIVEHMERQMNEEIALLETQWTLLHKELSEIKTRRQQHMGWRSSNN